RVATLLGVIATIALAGCIRREVMPARAPETSNLVPPAALPAAPATAPATAPAATPAAARPAARPPLQRAELPRGRRAIFPEHRLVGFCGTPGAPNLGKLAGDLAARAKAIETYAAKYSKDRKVLPIFELIAVVVQGTPGPDGKYRRRVADSVVDDYLRAAR